MREQLQNIKTQAEEFLKKISSISELEDFRVKFLGKKGELTQVLRQMGSLSPKNARRLGSLPTKSGNI